MDEADAGRRAAELVETAFADPALASLRAGGAPALVVAQDPIRIAWANKHASALFGGDAAALGRRLIHGGEPGALRIVALSRSLLPGAPARLERLRFFFGPVAETVTVMCRRVVGPDGANLLALAVLGARAQPKAPASVASINIPPAEAEPAPLARPSRFSWRTDADHVVTTVSGGLAAAVGEGAARLAGRSFLEAAEKMGLDPSGRLAAALATRDTWSGVQASWPAGDGSQRAPVMLGASPEYDADGRFVGFRGYGVVSPERIASSAATAETIAAGPPPAELEVSVPAPAEPGLTGDEFEPPTPFEPEATAHATEEAAEPAPGHQEVDGEERAPDEIVSVTDGGVAVYQDHAESPAPEERQPEFVEPVLTDLVTSELPPDEDEADEIEPIAPPPSFGKVVPLRPQFAPRPPVEHEVPTPFGELSPGERSAFEEIARTLSAETGVEISTEPPISARASRRARDLIDLVQRFGRSDDETPAPVEPKREEVAQPVVAAQVEPPRDPLAQNAIAILDRIPVGVVVSRFNVAIYANRTLLDLLDFADVDAFHSAGGLDRLFHGRTPDSGAAQIETRDGELIAVDARVQAIEFDGEPATLVTLRRAVDNGDAARARALELDLRQRDAEARELHAILDTATDGVAVLDANGRVLSLNRSGEALFGYDENEVAGEDFTVLVARESHDAVGQYFDGVKAGGVASVMNDGREIVGRARQGGSIPIFMTLGRLGAGATPKFCAVLRDLTAWKKAERELGDARREAERASALKSDFLAKVSHEIRTPLNAILGFAEVIMDERFGPVGNARYRDYMRDIHKSGEHVLSLVNDLLDLSKIEAGKVELDFTSVDANAVVAECVSLMQPQASRERVVIRLSLAPGLPNIVADERSLKQIVINLLSNAVKYNQPGGQVIVSTALTDAGHAVVRIKDTGVGMSDAELETALEPFRQIATSRKIEGTGLGLPLTKALVEANRASFTIKSRKNEGTLVEVVFPPTRVLAE